MRRPWVSVAGMVGFVLLLHLAGWGLLLIVVAPQGFNLGTAGTFS